MWGGRGGGGMKGLESNTFLSHFHTPCQREVAHTMDHASDCAPSAVIL